MRGNEVMFGKQSLKKCKSAAQLVIFMFVSFAHDALFAQSNAPTLKNAFQMFLPGFEDPESFHKLLYDQPGDTDFEKIAIGYDFHCGIKKIIKNGQSQSTVQCWGLNESLIAKTPKLNSPTHVVVGGQHACALAANSVSCWGENNYQQLDVPPLKNPTNIFASGAANCAIDQNGLSCWGSFKRYGAQPLIIEPRYVAMANDHICALAKDGVICWGENTYGQINVPPLVNPRAVAVGYHFSCALDDEGVKCWGTPPPGFKEHKFKSSKYIEAKDFRVCVVDDEGLRCFDNNYWPKFFVPNVELNGLETINIGYRSLCALFDIGKLKCWNLKESPFLKNPRQYSLGRQTACAIDDEKIKCWGYDYNPFYETLEEIKNPTAISSRVDGVCAITDSQVHCTNGDKLITWSTAFNGIQKIVSGAYFSCAMDSSQVRCTGSVTSEVPLLQNPKSIAAGGEHVCAIDSEGVKCWGDNRSQQIEVPILLNPREIAAGSHHSCAIDDSGVKCWGNNFWGQLNIPQLEKPGSIFSQSSLGHTCVIDGDFLVCWGKKNLKLNLRSYFLEAKEKKSAVFSTFDNFYRSQLSYIYKDFETPFENPIGISKSLYSFDALLWKNLENIKSMPLKVEFMRAFYESLKKQLQLPEIVFPENKISCSFLVPDVLEQTFHVCPTSKSADVLEIQGLVMYAIHSALPLFETQVQKEKAADLILKLSQAQDGRLGQAEYQLLLKDLQDFNETAIAPHTYLSSRQSLVAIAVKYLKDRK